MDLRGKFAENRVSMSNDFGQNFDVLLDIVYLVLLLGTHRFLLFFILILILQGKCMNLLK